MLGKKPYRVCVLRQLGGCGDAIMLSPVFRGLKEKYGKHCQVTVATTWAYGAGALPDLWRNNEFVDSITRVEPTEYAPEMLRSNRWEFSCVPNDWIPECVRNSDETIELNVICSIVETAEMMTAAGVQTHRTDIWANHAQVNPSSKKPILNLTKDELAEGKEWCDKNLGEGKRVGVVLRTMAPERNWPWTSAFTLQLHRQGYKVVTLDTMNKINDEMPAVIGKRIRPVAAIIAHLDAVVTPDTGLLHVAGAVGTPILGLFGSTHGGVRMTHYAGSYTAPERIVPCAPCFYKYGCKLDKNPKNHLACMKKLSVPLIEHELEKLLDKYGGQRAV
jgi:ADP-heptose:LPS heptosyltransferase